MIYRQEASDVFYTTFNNYLHYAFPKDDLRPMSCKGRDSLGGISITLLDCLDTLILMNHTDALKEAIRLVHERVSFEKDHMINVFELNIRGLGGLTSAHALLLRNPDILPGYKNELLDAAKDLGSRLFKAFDHFNRLPAGSINLKTGGLSNIPGHVSFHSSSTCVACAGTLLLEMAMLGRLIDDPIYEEKTKTTMKIMYDMRSNVGLVGNSLDTERESWLDAFSSTGANSDSYYEYLIKGYLLLGDEDYLIMFKDLYVPIMKLQKSEFHGHHQWIVDAYMESGYAYGTWVSSLSAFWPGMQVLAGQTEDAKNLNNNYTSVWMRFGSLPEKFSLDGDGIYPSQNGYPLRPEHIESTFYVYTITEDPHYLEVGRVLQRSALASNTTCGYAQLRDVSSGEMEDRMESFFLAETVKYMYLLDSNITTFVNAFVFTTEAHIYPPQSSKHDFKPIVHEIPQQCKSLCDERDRQQLEEDVREMEEKFPLLRVTVEDFKLLRYRRCIACIHVTAKMQDKPLQGIEETTGNVTEVEHTLENDKAEEIREAIFNTESFKDAVHAEDILSNEETDDKEEGMDFEKIDEGQETVSAKETDGDKELINGKDLVKKEESGSKSTVPEKSQAYDESQETGVIYDAVAIVRCLLELDPNTHKFRCAEVEDVATKDFLKESEVYTKGPAVFLVLRRPRRKIRRAVFVLSMNSEWIELEGQFLHRNSLKPTNATSQSCPAEVLSSLSKLEEKSRELQLAKCRRSLVFGKVVSVRTNEDCTELKNIEELEDAVAVLDDFCGSRRNIESIVQAGAVAVVYIAQNERHHQTSKEMDFQVPIPVLFISARTGNRVMMALEEHDDVRGMLGLTSAISLTKCPFEKGFLKMSAVETCSSGRVELLIPTDDVKHALSVFFAGKDMNFIVQRLHMNLREDEVVISKLLEQEKHSKT